MTRQNRAPITPISNADFAARASSRQIGGIVFYNRRNLTAFTLMEVMMVVVVVGILASIALPTYTKTIERSYHRQAEDLLSTIYFGEQARLAVAGSFFGPLDTTSTALDWAKIYMDNPHLGASPAVKFEVKLIGPNFKAEATRDGGSMCDTKQLSVTDTARDPSGNWDTSCGLF